MRQMQQNGEKQVVSASSPGDASQRAAKEMTPAPSQPRSSQKFSRRALRTPVRMQQQYAVQMA